MTSTQTLAEFLLARVAEDEAAAKAATPGPWRGNELSRDLLADGEIPTVVAEIDTRGDRIFAATLNPARVLAECEAKRRIVEEHALADWPVCRTCAEPYDHEWLDTFDRGSVQWPCPTLRALASAYVDHPDFRPEWRA